MPVGYVLSILAAAIAASLIGAAWYSPLLFAKPWARAHGFDPDKRAAMRATAGHAFLGSFVVLLIVASVLRIFVSHLGVESPNEGAAWGFHAWLGFALPIGFTAHQHSDKPFATFLIDAGYQLVYFTAMGAILGSWH
jgi:Protein of unknown function (DUF1761)